MNKGKFMKKKILVLFGGKSVEHDISVITALQVLKNLPQQYDFLPVYMDKNGIWWTAENLNESETYVNFEKKAKKRKQITVILGQNEILAKKRNKFVHFCNFDGVLNCCHGNIGEDGSVQGVFKICNVFQTSSDLTSMAICMDKAYMKDILSANNINSPKYVYFNRCSYEHNKQKYIKQLISKIGFPLIVKPANLGSSIGISVCKNQEKLEEALSIAFAFDEKVLIEKLVENLREFNCACFKYKGKKFASSVNEVKNKSEIYSFEDKYLSENAKNQETEKKLSRKIQKLTEEVYALFDCKGVVRVDFLFDEKSEQLFVNEINSIPGSLGFYLFKDIAFKEVVASILQEGEDVFLEQNKKLRSFESDALKIFNTVSKSLKK